MNRRIDVEGWSLVVAERDDGEREPRIEDEELGRRLGFDRERDIRKLIARYTESGELQGVHVRATVARTSMPNGGEREVAVNVYELTEEQACFVAAKSETPAANALLKEMIHVFVLARRGMLDASSGAAVLRQLTPVIAAAISEAMRVALASQPVADRSTIGASGAGHINRALKQYATLIAGSDSAKYRAELSAAHVDLRAALGFSGTGRGWANLPLSLWPQARARIDEMQRHAVRVAHDGQLDLPHVDKVVPVDIESIVLDAVRSNPGIRFRALCEVVARRRQTVGETLKVLHAKGAIVRRYVTERGGGNRWFAAGAKELEAN